MYEHFSIRLLSSFFALDTDMISVKVFKSLVMLLSSRYHFFVGRVNVKLVVLIFARHLYVQGWCLAFERNFAANWDMVHQFYTPLSIVFE